MGMCKHMVIDKTVDWRSIINRNNVKHDNGLIEARKCHHGGRHKNQWNEKYIPRIDRIRIRRLPCLFDYFGRHSEEIDWDTSGLDLFILGRWIECHQSANSEKQSSNNFKQCDFRLCEIHSILCWAIDSCPLTKRRQARSVNVYHIVMTETQKKRSLEVCYHGHGDLFSNSFH